jgi:predicted porin
METNLTKKIISENRITYLYQLLIARKMTSNLSLQIMPSLVHKNLVATKDDKNDIIIIGAGGRYKFTKRSSINVEYHYVLPDQINSYDIPIRLL